MEVELKFKIPDKTMSEKIWEDKHLSEIEEKDTREQLYMKAAYFDTDDFLLSKNDIAFRIRAEGDKSVASLKWNDKDAGIGGLHMREEINVPVNDESCFIDPKPEIFKESNEGRDLLEVIGDNPLKTVIETNFYRKKFRIDDGTCICEVSLDLGEIISGDKTEPISELEIELFSGKQEDLLKIGDYIVEEYGLEPEKSSKYARGLALLKDSKNK